MAKYINELEKMETSDLSPNDILPIEDISSTDVDKATKKITYEDLMSEINSDLVIEINRAKARENAIEATVPDASLLATKVELSKEIERAVNEENSKVDKETGKTLISATEVTRLAKVFNYDDSSLKARVRTLEDSAIIDSNYVHTDNNFTDKEKAKLSNLENYDDTEIKKSIDDEAIVRQSADAQLQENVDKETDRAAFEENKLDVRITAVEAKIPTQATADNQLADKEFVNSSIATATATFRGTYTSLDELKAAEGNLNDYAFYQHEDAIGNKSFDRYKYTTEWEYEYTLNSSSFTAAQWAAINSGITNENLNTIETTLLKKQNTLVSNENIKTVNGESILGPGDISINEATWGKINGEISNQVDLTTYVGDKIKNFVEVSDAPTVGKVWFNNSPTLEDEYIYTKGEVDNLLDNVVPKGGTTGQALIKNSNDDYDCTWGESGKIDDVKVDGASVVTDKVANITTKVSDIEINGTSIINNKVANVSLGEPNCKYKIPRWLRFNPSNKKGLIIKAGTSIKLANGTYKYYSSDTAIDLSSYISTSGAEYYVYLANDGTVTAYTSYQTSKGVKIGRFHTLCASVGTPTMTAPAKPSSGLTIGSNYLVKSYGSTEDADFYALYNKTISAVTVQTYYDVITCPHPLSGFTAGDILPESVFCLSFYPVCKYEDGQVYDRDTDSVVDIYLQSGSGDDTRSVYNATHRVSRQPWNHQEDMRMVGKRLLRDCEFTSAAIGSNEKTNITGSSDKTTVGGHSDTAGRRMISAIGCEEMCGYLWQWLDEIAPDGGSGLATNDGHASFGQGYGTPYVLGAGGNWSNGANCGSRSRSSANSRSNVAGHYGGRGLSQLKIGV